jgi:pimeloyl-ACP methyl ester carboxylesterase
MRRVLLILAIVPAVLVAIIAVVVLVFALRLRHQRARQEALFPFYNPPIPLAAGHPGDVIRSEPVDNAPAGVTALRVLYHSTSDQNRDLAVSALVLVPGGPAPAGGFPVVALAHGTVGNARVCAPSLEPFEDRLTQASFYDQMLASFITAGYAVAATDYVGLGTPGVAPYLVGEDAGRNVLDAARMIRRLAGLSLSDTTFIWGHSQGGQAAAFAGQLAPTYAPELHILGVVAGSPAAELGLLANEAAAVTKRSPLTGLIVMIVRAWSVAYPNAKAESMLTARAVDRMKVIDEDCVAGDLLAFLLRPAPDYIKAGGVKAAPWPELITRNTPGAARTPAPMLIFQGGSDPLIRPQFTALFVQRLCAVGDTVAFNQYAGKGHLSVIEPSMPDTLAWMSDRTRGGAPPTACQPSS